MPLSEEFQRLVNDSDEASLIALLRALQVRLGTPNEGPDDVDRATAVMHQVNNLRTLQAFRREVARMDAEPPKQGN